MKVESWRTMSLQVADRWKAQYFGRGVWRSTKRGPTKLVYEKLRALKGQGTIAQVAKIIGNKTWVRNPLCGECNKNREVVVQLGAEPDYESATAYICLPCLRRAVALAEKQAAKGGAG